MEERIVFQLKNGYFPHLSHPRSFNEKICNRKLFNPVPDGYRLADKYAVRKYVQALGLGEILNEVYVVTENPNDIDLAKLPAQFVIKATHGSGWNLIVRDKTRLSREDVVKQCNRWLTSVYGEATRESFYRNIHPAILVERFLDDGSHDIPPDYKFFVFHGRCEFIQVDYDRYNVHTRTIYDRDWKPQDFNIRYPLKTVNYEKPATLGWMLEISERLSRGVDFCRVDLYSIGDRKVYFGEITLTPAAGLGRFIPDPKGDFLMGSLW